MSMTRLACLSWATILVSGLAACGGSEPEPATTTATTGSETPPPATNTPPPSPARVRVLHLAVGAANAQVNATAGTAEAPIAQVTGVAFKSASAYTDLTPPAGAPAVSVSITAGQATASFEAPVRPGSPATVIVVSNPQNPQQLAVTATEDDMAAVTGQIRGRFVNALLGTASVDFCLPGATRRESGRPLFTDVQYGQVAGTQTSNHYIPVSLAGGGAVQVRAHADNGCTGRVIGTAQVPPPNNDQPHNFTLAVVGSAGRPRVAPELLLCEDAPGQSACAAIPLR